MTEGEYRAELKKRGLTPYMASYQGATVYVDREGSTHSIPDPDTMSPEQRVAFIELLDLIVGEQ
jgi:hypothetical protein